VKLLGQIIFYCRLYQEAHNRNIVLQQQLDDSNAKFKAGYSLNSKFKMQRFSNLKSRSRKAKQPQTITVNKL
jgi:hypothetical protein